MVGVGNTEVAVSARGRPPPFSSAFRDRSLFHAAISLVTVLSTAGEDSNRLFGSRMLALSRWWMVQMAVAIDKEAIVQHMYIATQVEHLTHHDERIERDHALPEGVCNDGVQINLLYGPIRTQQRGEAFDGLCKSGSIKCRGAPISTQQRTGS